MHHSIAAISHNFHYTSGDEIEEVHPYAEAGEELEAERSGYVETQLKQCWHSNCSNPVSFLMASQEFEVESIVDKRQDKNGNTECLIRWKVIQFKKPIVVSVNGPAIGLGASILPLCDLVWANEKAWFQTPYMTFGQSPDGCSTITFQKMMGKASANEMLFAGRKLTARESCAKGLVSQVFLSGTFAQEVMIQIKELASYNQIVLEESKALVCCNIKLELEQANERECEVLRKIWSSAQGIESMLKYVENKTDEF
nr:testis-specific chromodomain protein Y 1-like [Pongo abelii]